MANFWDSNVWGFLNLFAVLLVSLLAANALKRAVRCLEASLIPTSVLAGAHSAAQLLQSAAYEEMPEEERDYAAALAAFPKISWEGHCMYCSHCAPCPQRIDVASVTKFLNLSLAQGSVPETVREHYRVLPAHAGDCIRCGVCETRCPFAVKVRENMEKAERVFGY